MTETQYGCPFCSYSAGAVGSVKAHITRSTDTDHKGRSGPDYSEEIEPVEVDNSTGDDGGADGSVEFPVADGAGSGDGQGSGDADREELPCGHESFDPEEAPEPPFEVSCEECGRSWVVNAL